MEDVEMNNIQYGRKMYKGKLCGRAKWMEGGRIVEVISPPYENLLKFVSGKPSQVTLADVSTWTMVAGWLGTKEFLKKFEKVKKPLQTIQRFRTCPSCNYTWEEKREKEKCSKCGQIFLM